MSDEDDKGQTDEEGAKGGAEPEAPAEPASEASAKAAAPDGSTSRRRRRKRPSGDDAKTDEPGDLSEAVVAALPPEALVAASGSGVEKEDAAPSPALGDGDRMDLPKWNRAKVKRKQPKGEEQDAFQSSVRKAGRTALSRAPVVIGLIVAVAGLIAGVFWYRDKVQEDEATATRILSAAVGVQARGRVADVAEATKDRKLPPPVPLINDEGERVAQVDKALADLAEAAPDSDANKAAGLVRASRLVEAGKFTEAEASFRDFVTKNGSHKLVFLAREGLALSLEAMGNSDDAIVELDKLAADTGAFYRDQALWQKGRILEAQGKSDEALEVYKLYLEEYPLAQKSIARDSVVARLDELAPELVPADAKKPGLGGLGGLGGGFGLPPGLGQ